jgi:hypothetical protein
VFFQAHDGLGIGRCTCKRSYDAIRSRLLLTQQAFVTYANTALHCRPSTTSTKDCTLSYPLTIMRKAILSTARRAPRPRQLHEASHTASLSSSHAQSPSVQITTLPNKLRVVTENTPGHFSSVGLYVDAGSRYETPTNSGVSHFLDRMAFKVGT